MPLYLSEEGDLLINSVSNILVINLLLLFAEQRLLEFFIFSYLELVQIKGICGVKMLNYERLVYLCNN